VLLKSRNKNTQKSELRLGFKEPKLQQSSWLLSAGNREQLAPVQNKGLISLYSRENKIQRMNLPLMINILAGPVLSNPYIT